MAEVLFITPNIDGDLREEPIGTLLLGTILRQSGIEVDILQFYHFGELKDLDSFLDRAVTMTLEKAPKIVSFYTRCDTYHITLTLAREIKARRPDIWIVFGGPQSDITARDTVKEIDWVDFVCCGEGENTVVPLFSSLIKGAPDLSVPGIVYKADGEVVQNPRPALIENLDTLPMIDYSLLKYVEGRQCSGMAALFPVDVGRGCPFGCTYCSTKTFWGQKYRLKSPERILLEIKDINERFGVREFAFEHDMFTMKRAQVIDTCRLLKTLDFPVTWRCSARLDCLDEELLDIMADAGLEGLYIGIETGSPRMQKLIKKNLKLERVMPMMDHIVRRGLKATVSFIYGFPEETEEDISQTMEMVAQLEALPGVIVQTHLCTFLPGTELSERYAAQMCPSDSYSDFVRSSAFVECADIIEAHPSIFQHLFEYKTPLRSKLQYIPAFFEMWTKTAPVYRYISERYGQGGLLAMYCDFVSCNEAVLDQLQKLPAREQVRQLLREDRFIERLKDDENYDIIQDIYRLHAAQSAKKQEGGGTVTDVYCFSPRDLTAVSDLRQIKRCVTMVTSTVDKNGNIQMQIFNRK